MNEQQVASYYEMGLYDNEELKTFVDTGYFSAAKFEELTGTKYKVEEM